MPFVAVVAELLALALSGGCVISMLTFVMLSWQGADTVIYERLDRNYPLTGEMKDVTLQHMEDFGSAGLRTLCLAYAELDDHFYEE